MTLTASTGSSTEAFDANELKETGRALARELIAQIHYGRRRGDADGVDSSLDARGYPRSRGVGFTSRKGLRAKARSEAAIAKTREGHPVRAIGGGLLLASIPLAFSGARKVAWFTVGMPFGFLLNVFGIHL